MVQIWAISVRARVLFCGFSNIFVGVGVPMSVRGLLCGFGKALEVAMPVFFDVQFVEFHKS